MDGLYLLLTVAKITAGEGSPCTVSQLRDETRYSKSYIHMRLKELMRRGYVLRISRGRYALNGSNVLLRNVGFATVLPMDIYEYHSIMSQRLKSA